MEIFHRNKAPKWQSTIQKLGKGKVEGKPHEKFEHRLALIKKLHQKEIGDYSRLESIRNYLNDGKAILFEDEEYLKKQFSELQKISSNIEELDYQNSVPNKDSSEPQTILIDDVEQNPTSNFKSLGKTIAKIIKDSTPHFTIGIYGEWGTGKTTLMNAIEKNLEEPQMSEKEKKVLTIWFNAWQYERDENLVTVSLMKTVAFAMAGHEKYDAVSKTILKGLTIVGKDISQSLVQEIISNKNEESMETFDEKINYLNKLYQDSIYFDGLKKIKQQMDAIRKLEGNDYRVIIFIDDLDRCSPKKALEVLESVKLFLSMDGFVFVLGLSHKTVTQLITQAYTATGVKGEDYIKKIIQIPIKIPTWSQENIVDLIENKIKQNLHEEYTDFLCENSNMIAKIVEYNPRQLKRFVNNVIIAFETFTGQKNSPKIKFNEIFLLKILQSEWPDFYNEMVSSYEFREIVKWMISKPKDLKKYFKYLNTYNEAESAEKKQQRFLMLNKISERTNGKIDDRQVEILSDFDFETWIFFSHCNKVLCGIKDWDIINTVMNIVEEIPYDLPVGSANSSKNEKQIKT